MQFPAKQGGAEVPYSPHILYELKSEARQAEHNLTAKVLLAALKEIIPEPSEAKVLDFGCGRGELLAQLKAQGYQTYGVDMDEHCVKLSEPFGNVYQGNLKDLPQLFEERFFDVVISSHVLEHLPSPGPALTELWRLCKQGVLIAVPNPYYTPYIVGALMRRVTQANRGHLYSWDYAHFKAFVANYGFTVKTMYYDSVALPLRERTRNALGVNILTFVEGKLLRKLFPRFCRSIIAYIVK